MKSDRLFRWVRAATKAERQAVADSVGIGSKYLEDMARWLKTGKRCFPHDTADRIADAITSVNARAGDGGLPLVEWEHLTDPCDCSRCSKAAL